MQLLSQESTSGQRVMTDKRKKKKRAKENSSDTPAKQGSMNVSTVNSLQGNAFKKINVIIISNSGAKVNCFAFFLVPIAPCESYNSEPCSTGPLKNMVNCSSFTFSLISAQHLPTFHSFFSLQVIVIELPVLLVYLTCVF